MNSANDKPYIFISYAHANSDKVLPTVAAMKKSGINLWYDEGIVAGSEWPEFIAEKVVGCDKFVLFVSDAYLNSQNCKRELNFAISRKKNILTIFLEDVHLSPGVEMQLGTYQAIYRNRFQSDNIFWDSLCKEPFFNDCRETITAQREEPSQNVNPQNPNNPYREVPFQNVNPQNRANVNPPVFHASTPVNQPFVQQKVKDKNIAALLALFVGTFGGHHFYLGDTLKGILCILLFWTYIPGILGLIQGIMFLVMSEEKFQQKYVNKQRTR